MAQLGLDVEQMQTLVTTMRNQVDAIGQIRSTVDGVVANTWWQGGDADMFRDKWSQFNGVLSSIAETFAESANAAQSQLQQQQDASSV